MFTFQESGWGPTEDLAVDITAQSAEGTPRLPDNQESQSKAALSDYLCLDRNGLANMTHQTWTRDKWLILNSLIILSPRVRNPEAA